MTHGAAQMHQLYSSLCFIFFVKRHTNSIFFIKKHKNLNCSSGVVLAYSQIKIRGLNEVRLIYFIYLTHGAAQMQQLYSSLCFIFFVKRHTNSIFFIKKHKNLNCSLGVVLAYSQIKIRGLNEVRLI